MNVKNCLRNKSLAERIAVPSSTISTTSYLQGRCIKQSKDFSGGADYANDMQIIVIPYCSFSL